MISITRGKNEFGYYELYANRDDELPTTFPMVCSNGVIRDVKNGQDIIIVDANEINVRYWDEESQSWIPNLQEVNYK